MGWRQGSVAADHTLLTAGAGGCLSAEVFTSLLLMAEDFPGEPGAVKEADNHPIFPVHFFPDGKIQFLVRPPFEQFSSPRNLGMETISLFV